MEFTKNEYSAHLELFHMGWRSHIFTDLLTHGMEAGISETLKKVSVSTTFDQSLLVSTTTNFHIREK